MWTPATCSEFSFRAICRAVNVLAVAAALASLPACGGGGGTEPPPVTYTLSGTITNAMGSVGVAGVKVALTGTRTASATTDSAGGYTLAALPNGTYTVTPTLSGTAFEPANRSVTIAGASVGNVDFLALSGSAIATGVEFLPEWFSSGEQLRASLMIRDGYAYFTDSSTLPLKRAALDGSGVTSLAGRFEGARNVLVRGTDVYWVDASHLNRTPLAGGATTLLAGGSADHGDGTTADIVVDDSFVYWVNSVATQTCSPPCTWVIQKVALGGATPVTLATVNRKVAALAADATRIFWEEESLEPLAEGCNCGSSVKSVPKAGGAITDLVDGSLNGTMPAPPPGHIAASWLPTGGLALTSTEVLFARTGIEYEIKAIPLDGGSLRTLATVSTPSQYATTALQGLAVSGASVYFIDNGNHAFSSVPLAGGAVTALATNLGALSATNSSVMVVAGGDAYWSELGTTSGCCITGGTGAIRRLPIAGGAISTVLGGLDLPGSVSVAGSSLAWTEAWRVGKATTGGGGVATLASGISSDMARIAVDAASIYVLDGSFIIKVPLGGGQPQKLAYTNDGVLDDLSLTVQDIATDGTSVYWTTTNGPFAPVVRKVSVVGGATTTIASEALFVNPQDCYWRIAVRGQNVYWSAGGTGGPISCAVKKVPIDGGAVTTVIDYPYLADFTVDDSFVYFSDGGESYAIHKIPVTGGDATVVAANAAGWVMTHYGSRLYWVDLAFDTVGSIEKSAVDGAASYIPGELLLEPLDAFEAITVDGSGLYLTETQTGTIYAVH